MKKILKSITIFAVLILISISAFATEVADNSVNEDLSSYDQNIEDGIMPISYISNEDFISSDPYLKNYETSDIWRMENHTKIENSVYGDLYIMSNSAEILSNSIEGNAFIMADSVKISGNIYGSVFIMANNVEISGKIEDAYIMANTVNITETGEISRNIKVGANTFNLKGSIYRNLSVVSDNINMESNSAGVSVAGNLKYSGNLNADESQIYGEIEEVDISKFEVNKTEKAVSLITDFIVEIITALVIIALIVYFANCKYENKDIVLSDYAKDIGLGFLYLIIIPAVSILLMITVIGLPIGIFGLLLYIMGLYIAIPVASIEIARLILKENNTRLKHTFCALAVLVLFKILKYVPVIGDIVRFLGILLGIRIIVKTIFKKKSNKEKEVVETIEK